MQKIENINLLESIKTELFARNSIRKRRKDYSLLIPIILGILSFANYLLPKGLDCSFEFTQMCPIQRGLKLMEYKTSSIIRIVSPKHKLFAAARTCLICGEKFRLFALLCGLRRSRQIPKLVQLSRSNP